MASQIFIGVAGWSYPDWKGIVYPRGVKDQLHYLCQYIDCIEINSTFYRRPDEKISKSWLDRTENRPDFFFTAKLHKDFTHEGKISQDMVRQFHKGFEPLTAAGKLKHLLVQFRYDYCDNKINRRHLSAIVENFCEVFEPVVEVRHKSWENPDALDFLNQLGVTVCNLDYPTSKNSFDLQECTIGKTGYLRMHGRNVDKWFSKAGRDETYDYYYNDEELAQIKARIEKLAQAYNFLIVIANNHYRGAELANALELKCLLTGDKQTIPEGLLQAYPKLANIASNRSLF